MKVAVLNKRERMIICGDIQLLPGANYVEHGVVKAHKAMLDRKVESGCLELPKADIDDDLSESVLGAYNAPDAIKLIKTTNDYDTLMKFQIEEIADKKRKTVLEALEAQIKLNKEALTPQGDGDK